MTLHVNSFAAFFCYMSCRQASCVSVTSGFLSTRNRSALLPLCHVCLLQQMSGHSSSHEP